MCFCFFFSLPNFDLTLVCLNKLCVLFILFWEGITNNTTKTFTRLIKLFVFLCSCANTIDVCNRTIFGMVIPETEAFATQYTLKLPSDWNWWNHVNHSRRFFRISSTKKTVLNKKYCIWIEWWIDLRMTYSHTCAHIKKLSNLFPGYPIFILIGLSAVIRR